MALCQPSLVGIEAVSERVRAGQVAVLLMDAATARQYHIYLQHANQGKSRCMKRVRSRWLNASIVLDARS